MARKIAGAVFLSLDGVMQAPGGLMEDTQGGFAEGAGSSRSGIPASLRYSAPLKNDKKSDSKPVRSSIVQPPGEGGHAIGNLLPTLRLRNPYRLGWQNLPQLFDLGHLHGANRSLRRYGPIR